MSDCGLPKLHLRKKKTNVRRVGYLLLFLFAEPQWSMLVIGTGLVLVAVLIHGWAAGYLARAGYGSRETVLTVRGPYRHNRNPYYVSHLIMDLGFFTAAGFPHLYPFYVPFIFTVYAIWVYNEEKFLTEEFEEAYETMKQKVPRWWIRLTPAPTQGHEEEFTWEDYFLNNEFKRTLCHLFLIGLLWDFFYLANPFLYMDISSRMTLLSLYVLWILCRNATREGTGNRRGLIITGICGFLFVLISLLLWLHPLNNSLPVFLQLWGVIVVTVAAGFLIDPIRRHFSQFYEDHFRTSLSFLFEFLIGIGLTSGSFFILWWTITLTLFLWALDVEFDMTGRLSPLIEWSFS
ncbi:MAG: isoprenylcysteine carboxylmethyltransferase family protein [bacterium]